MTTATMTKNAPQRKSARKPLRIRPELLPESATYGTFAEREYVMIPVEDFGDWYEDIEDSIIAEERERFDTGERFPLDEIAKHAHGNKVKICSLHK